eukprot:900391-Amphidinium_carterae.1
MFLDAKPWRQVYDLRTSCFVTSFSLPMVEYESGKLNFLVGHYTSLEEVGCDQAPPMPLPLSSSRVEWAPVSHERGE